MYMTTQYIQSKAIKPSNSPLYLVDFDGVICDSRFECMITSYVAYHKLFNGDDFPFDASTIAANARAQFIQYRYLARTAREFALLWDLINAPSEINADKWLSAHTNADKSRLSLFHEAFYAARYQWMEIDISGWLKVHQFYPEVKSVLIRWLAQDRVHIVSSKDSRSILALLHHQHIEVPESLVGGCESGDKNEHFRRLCEATERDMAFIDDNLENLITAKENGIKPYLASWGYTSTDMIKQAEQKGFQILTLPVIEYLN